MKEKSNIFNTSPVPYASKTNYNSGNLTSCLGFCHINMKRMIPLKNDYSLKNDYYIMGITNSTTLGPNGGVFIYYIMKIEEIITFATAYKRFPEWRADKCVNPREKPLPIKPIADNDLMKYMKSQELYIVNKNNKIICSFPHKYKKKDKKELHEKIKNNFSNLRICMKIYPYDQEFMEKERRLEATEFIKSEKNNFSIIYEYIPKAHHNEVEIAFKDLKTQKKKYPFEQQNAPTNKRNGDRLFLSYSNFKYFGKTLSLENNICQSYFEINKEIMNVLKKNLRKYTTDTYMKSVDKRTPRGKNPHMANINPLVIKGEDVSKILEILAPEFN